MDNMGYRGVHFADYGCSIEKSWNQNLCIWVTWGKKIEHIFLLYDGRELSEEKHWAVNGKLRFLSEYWVSFSFLDSR